MAMQIARLTGPENFNLRMLRSRALYKMAELSTANNVVPGKRKQQKPKQFRWECGMIESLITCLENYKSQMEYKGIDFDGDRPAQYSWLRQELAKIYCEDTSLFGPISVTSKNKSLSAMSKQELKAHTEQTRSENESIRKGYARIREKVKEIRQSFSQAVINGKRSGSGKIVFEFYDKLVTIWGGAAATEPLSFGVSTDILQQTEQAQIQADEAQVTDDHDDSDAIQPVVGGPDQEAAESNDEELAEKRKRKIDSHIPKLIDNKRKHLEKGLSAAQRDTILLNEAKEDSTFRKNLADATREATACFSNALKDVSSCMTQLGNGLSRSIEILAQAVMSQAMANTQSQPMPFNQNLFYQSIPNAYPTSLQYNVHNTQSIGMHPTPAQDKESIVEENVYRPL